MSNKEPQARRPHRFSGTLAQYEADLLRELESEARIPVSRPKGKDTTTPPITAEKAQGAGELLEVLKAAIRKSKLQKGAPSEK